MVNKVILVGNLGKDPELRQTPGGQPVASFTMATSEKYKDREGVLQERTEWHNIVVWGRQAEIVKQYCQKGKTVYCEGRIQTRKWQDKEGKDRYTTEIVVDNIRFLGGGNRGEGGGGGGEGGGGGYGNRGGGGGGNYGGGGGGGNYGGGRGDDRGRSPSRGNDGPPPPGDEYSGPGGGGGGGGGEDDIPF